MRAQRIGVAGAGVMGSEIAEVAAAAGLDVVRSIGERREALAGCDVIIEATTEVMAVKREVFARPDVVARPDAVLASESGSAPIGPFALGDLIGLDTLLHVQRDLEDAYGDRFAVGDELGALVAAGNLGAKTGSGVLSGPGADAIADAAGRDVAERYHRGAVDVASRCVTEGVAAPDDTDLAITLGDGWETGPLGWDQGRAR